MTVNRAVLIKSQDANDLTGGLEVADTSVPEPAEGRVLVRVLLRPVNPVDTFCVLGVYPGYLPKTSPSICGSEGLGKVVKNGPGCKKFSEGTRVVGAPFEYFAGNGTWQQYVTIPEDNLVAVPDALSDMAAAQFYINPMTVYGMLSVLDLPRGSWLLQTAGGSAVGRLVIQLAKHRGIKTISTVRRAEQREELLALGADEVVCTNDEDLGERVKEVTGGDGATAALDCIAGEMTGTVLSALRPRGKVLVYGLMDGPKFSANVMDCLFHNKVVTGFALNVWLQTLEQKDLQEAFRAVLDLMAKGVLQPQDGPAYPLDQVKEALEASVKPARGAKVFLEG